MVPWGIEAIPRVSSSRPNGSEQKERWWGFARLPLESGYIHRGEAPPIDVYMHWWRHDVRYLAFIIDIEGRQNSVHGQKLKVTRNSLMDKFFSDFR